MEQLSEIYSSYSERRRATGVLLGYKLIVESILYRQIDLIVTCPEILHLKADEELRRWWLTSEDKTARRFRGITDSDAPKSTLVASYINELMLRVDRSGNRLKQFTEASTEVSSFVQAVLAIASTRHLSVITESDYDRRPDLDHALLLCGAEYLYDILYDDRDRTLSNAFDFTSTGSLGWIEGSIVEGLGRPAVETSRDGVVTLPHRRRGAQEFSGLGFNAALTIAIQKLTGQHRVVYRDDIEPPPAGELFGDILEEFQVGRWPSMRYGLIFRDELSEEELKEIMVLETPTPDAQERLKALLGDSTAFLVSGSGNAEFHFQVLIEGLLRAQAEDAPIEVLRIEHADGPVEAHPPISLAVLVGRDWHVFNYIDAIGRMKSWVWPFLDGLGERVRITEVPDISTEYLLCLCDQAFQYVTRQWKAQKDLNTHLRSE
ncbi:MAG: hypothetical protein OXC95_06020 [Dehalococcoidia bacterium]|nr:hypothetical protein [Dehalococcoidia bacterium]